MGDIVSVSGIFEPFSSLSHLLGAAFFAVLSVFLLRRGRGNRARMISLAIFCFGTVFLLSVSGAYHLLDPTDSAKPVLRRLDHAAIFVLIACSFTPAHIILFRGWERWTVLLLVWLFAIVAITLKMIFFREMSPRLGLMLYLTMGWLGVFTGLSVWRRYGFRFMQPMLWGGIAYSIGGILESVYWPVLVPGVIQWHEIFHVSVLIGLGFHWAFAFTIADGRLSPEADSEQTSPSVYSSRVEEKIQIQ